ncbi:MAG: sulfatase-like hydrolase/transferase [Planctomycetota bacterium]|jgi:arylsulfatase A-like enzyme
MKAFKLGVLVTLSLAALRIVAADKPNIVLLFADDAGYADFGFQGSRQFKTPHLDRLAASGVRLTQFYMTASVCGPSRAGMLTGRYQQRFGFEENNVPGIMSASGAMGEEMGLPLEIPTVADHLKRLGYRTAVFGKWHLGIADRFHPLKRGFDEFYGFRGGARSFYPYPTTRGLDRARSIERNFEDYTEHEGYLTTVLADETIAFIERHRDRPFFAYVSFNAVHTPMHAEPKDKNTFRNLEGNRRILAQMTLSLDRACGRIIHKLEQLGIRENTIVVFTNDNGGPSDKNASNNYPFSGLKSTLLEGGIRVPGVVSWPERLPAGVDYDHPASALDLLPTFFVAGGGDASTIQGLDGVDLTPYLKGENKTPPHPTLYWKKETRAAIRDGEWKLIRFPDRPAELYNLAEDHAEQDNLANTYPDKVKALFKKLFAWELELERPMFQLLRIEEGKTADRMDAYRTPPPNND